MTNKEKRVHAYALQLIAALNYKPAQTAKAMQISAKAVQQKTKLLEYNKFNAANLSALKAFILNVANLAAPIPEDEI